MSKGVKILLTCIFILLVSCFAGLIVIHHYQMESKTPVKTVFKGLEGNYTNMALSDDITANLSVSPAYGRTVTVSIKNGDSWDIIAESRLAYTKKDSVKLNFPNVWKSHKKTVFRVEISDLESKFNLFRKPHVVHPSKAKPIDIEVTTQKQIESKTCAVIDVDTGEVVYEWNGYKEHKPASMTKMMTAILFCENTESTESVIVSNRAAHTEWSGLLNEGDEISRDDLLYCMMLPSANDAAEAAGDYVEEKLSRDFRELMNEKANQLEMTKTIYENCCGLDTDGNVSCAVDQAILGAYLMTASSDGDFDTLRTIVSIQEQEVSLIRDKDSPVGEGVDEENLEEQKGKKKVTFKVGNTNDLLGADFDGIKTGYTDIAGPCLCATFVSDGKRYVSVVMGGTLMDDRFNDTKKLKKLVDKGYFNSED